MYVGIITHHCLKTIGTCPSRLPLVLFYQTTGLKYLGQLQTEWPTLQSRTDLSDLQQVLLIFHSKYKASLTYFENLHVTPSIIAALGQTVSQYTEGADVCISSR